MKLGLLTAAFPDTPLTEVADWAGANVLGPEVACWPRADGCSPLRRRVPHRRGRPVRRRGQGRAPGRPRHRDQRARHYLNSRTPTPRSAPRPWPTCGFTGGAAKLGVPVVNTFIGADAPLGENIAAAREFLPDLVSLARDSGVKLAIENCPRSSARTRAGRPQPVLRPPPGARSSAGSTTTPSGSTSTAPGLADDRHRAGGARVRPAATPRARQGTSRSTARGCSSGHHVGRDRLAGPTALASARSAGTGSWPPCTGSATTAVWSSSTRTATSRAATSWSRPASCWPATPSGPTSSSRECGRRTRRRRGP